MTTTAKRNSRIEASRLTMALVLAAAAVIAAVPAAQAGFPGPARVSVTGNVDIHVWLDQPMDIYPCYDDVVLSVQANRGCYATVFVVDTFGYIHVVHPFSPYEDAWIAGGVTYRLSGRDMGLDRFGGRGIVHVFAIGSPHPFDYSPYGEYVFAGRYGYRVYGDPYEACTQFYTALMPAPYCWDRVGIASARFYVRDWVRYPGYLCRCSHDRVTYIGTGKRCRSCGSVYDAYRVHVNDPKVVLRHTPRYKDVQANTKSETRVVRSAGIDSKYKSTYRQNRSQTTVKSTVSRSRIVSAKRTDSRPAVERPQQREQTASKSKLARATTVKSKVRTTADKERTVKTKNGKGRVSK